MIVPVREATENDIPQLVKHHRKMFEEMWEKKGECIDDSIRKGIEQAYAQKLKQELSGGLCRAWVIENDNRIVASGAITFSSRPPTPDDLSTLVAYLHSMYTEKEYRNNHFASIIVDKVVQYCRDNGIKRITLSASEAGRPVYERAGFRPSPETMKLLIE